MKTHTAAMEEIWSLEEQIKRNEDREDALFMAGHDSSELRAERIVMKSTVKQLRAAMEA